ncbi:MAG: type I-U CRISPR-associated protein Csb2 [Bryobacteraceae bacterium]
MFAIEVQFLTGRWCAGSARDRGEAEWPPHPARVFSAMVAAYAETGMGDDAERALLWLERQPAPEIHVPAAGKASDHTVFVPTNYVDKFGVHTKQPREFPSVPVEEPVYFIWRDSEPSAEVRKTLDEITARVPYLGKSRSPALVRLVDEAPASTHRPTPQGPLALRVAREGRLEELRRLWDAGRWYPFAPQERYGEATKAKLPVQTVFDEMVVLRHAGGPPLPIEATLTLTNAFRRALLSHFGGESKAPALLHGHADEPHCATVALPFTGGEHADGRLMGCGVVFPVACDPIQRRRVLVAVEAVAELGIALNRELGRWKVEPTDDTLGSGSTLKPETWKWLAKKFRSVTPILLDRYPKKRLPPEAILLESCQRAGLPEPVMIEHSPHSMVQGVPPVNKFRLQREKDEPPRWAVHADIEFAEPVRGPVILGAGRFFGLGLMRPVRAEGGDK